MASVLVSYCCITNCCEIRLSQKWTFIIPTVSVDLAFRSNLAGRYPLGITPEALTAVF